MRDLRSGFYGCLLLLSSLHLYSQELTLRPVSNTPVITVAAGKLPNANTMYQQLRNATGSGEVATVSNLVLKRDAGTFSFRSGNFYFLAPVNGKVTGAVFVGDGSFALVSPIASERQTISLLTKEPEVHEEFNSVVLRFTDDTYEEIKKTATLSKGVAAGMNELTEVNSALRRKLNYNLTGRLLQDVMSTEPGGAFFAFIRGKKYNDKEIFAVDPHGALNRAPEEVVFLTWDDNKFGTWAAFHYSSEYKNGVARGTQENGVIDLQAHKLDTQFERNGKLTGDATTTFKALNNGTQVVPFDLFSTLRVQSVTGQGGEALDFIQEDKDQDADFFVILPKPLAAGDVYSVRTMYSGKDAVSTEGGGNYYPVARDNWYPNGGLKDYALYDMTFRVPKDLKLAATGNRVKSVVEGQWSITEWQSPTYQSVAGFNFGQFKNETKKLADGFEIETFANTSTPDWLKGLEDEQVVNTTGMMKKALAEAELSIQLYSDYFGPTSFKRISMTQQTAGNYGQAWPQLIYLPLTSFLDSATRFRVMGFDPKGYFTVVAPHEVAHQWWGHTVGWASYRDQWMSEGFSQLSASLFIQMIAKDNKSFVKFWQDELETMTEKNRFGFRPIDVGPVTMGSRLSNSKSGFDIYGSLIYPKGGYILHMIRMMMWEPRTGDEKFKVMMRDFVKTYANRPASTEDFKTVVEKHMMPTMDLDGNRRMDWFFDEYVYGTSLPTYKLEQSVGKDEKGNVLKFKLTQSKVPDSFKMTVPVYVELGDGRIVRLGSIAIHGNSTVEQDVPIGQTNVKRALISYYNDVLALTEK
ncbi:MAG TPA: M1 family aminopeptidase [Terriglobales bacterium]|nr:M1 family aminopeptidase [Terriglobales bacterium]